MPDAPQQHRQAAKATAHQPARKHAPRRRAGSARERGYTTEWDKFSKAFLLSNPLCEFCLAKGKTVPAKVTDHDLPHRHDPALIWDNTFTALCHPCHSGTKQSLEARLDGDKLLAEVRRRKGWVNP